MIRAGFIVVLFAVGQAEDAKVPHEDDEIRLVRIKANPEEYAGKEFIICGGLEINDSYYGGYRDAKDSHYSLYFREIGETQTDLSIDSCRLYLSKKDGSPIVDAIADFAEQNRKKGVRFYKLARVKATILPRIFHRNDDKPWNLMEVVDVQFIEKDFSGWKPWEIETREKERRARENDARRKLAAKRDAEKEAAQKEKEAAEALKWREWTDDKGIKFKAKFSGVTSGQVKLVKEDGSAVKLALDKLPKEEQDWIKEKKWTKK